MNRPTSRSQVHGILGDLWRGTPEEDIGHSIVEFLARNTDAKHISLADLFNVVGKAEKRDVLNIIAYLTGNDLRLLDAQFEYIDDLDGEEIILRLDSEQVKAAKAAKINPRTGDRDEDIQKKIFMFFTPSKLAKEVLVEK